MPGFDSASGPSSSPTGNAMPGIGTNNFGVFAPPKTHYVVLYADVTATTVVSNSVIAIWESLAQVTKLVITNWESLAKISSSRVTNWEALAKISSSRITNWESLARVLNSRITNWESLARVLSSRITNWEALQRLQVSRITNWESLAKINNSRITNWESLARVNNSRTTPYEAIARVLKSIITNWEALAKLTSARITNWESLAKFSNSRTTPYEALAQVIKSRVSVWESLARALRTVVTNWEAAGTPAVFRTVATPYEALAQVTKSRISIYEALAKINNSRTTNWEAMAKLTSSRVTAFEALARVVSPTTQLYLDSDDFNRADTTSDLNPDITGLWATNTASVNTPRIVSQQLELGNDGFLSGQNILYRTTNNGPNQVSEFKFISATNGVAGPAVRIATSSGYLNATGYVAIYDSRTSVIQLRKFASQALYAGSGAAGGTQLGSDYSVTLALNDRLRISAIGTTLTVYVNDVLVIGPITDSSLATGRMGGFYVLDTGQMFVDNWRGGEYLAVRTPAYEALAIANKSRTTNWEAIQKLTVSKITNWESSQKLVVSRSEAYEALLRVQQVHLDIYEVLRRISNLVVTVWEGTSTFQPVVRTKLFMAEPRQTVFEDENTRALFFAQARASEFNAPARIHVFY